MPAWQPQFGWAGEELSDIAWDDPAMRAVFSAYPRKQTPTERFCYWDGLSEKILGRKFIPHQYQRIGSCVSHGMRNVLNPLQIVEIARQGDLEEWKEVYAPWLYGISRLMPEGGNGQLGSSDGSLGSWMARTIVKYGVLFADDEGVPPFSGDIEKRWGTRRSELEPFFPIAADNLLRSAARTYDAEEAADGIVNGHFFTIASNRGFDMDLADRDSKSWFKGRSSWAHQMCGVAFDVKPTPCVLIQNSWPENAHGHQLDGPPCSGWITLETLQSILDNRSHECFICSLLDGFPLLLDFNVFDGK